MRARVLFGPVMVIFFVCCFNQPILGLKDPATSKLSVRQQFDSEIDNLLKNLKASNNQVSRWKLIQKTESEITILRKKSAQQVTPDELYMETTLASLGQIPRGEKFKKQDCDKYRVEILVQFDPQSESKIDPAVSKTLNVLETLCK